MTSQKEESSKKDYCVYLKIVSGRNAFCLVVRHQTEKDFDFNILHNHSSVNS